MPLTNRSETGTTRPVTTPRASDHGAAKHALNEQFAHLGRALANTHRVEILDLLAQGERSVEVLASRARSSVGLASAHLQVLRRSGLVSSRRDGTRIVNRLSGDDVIELLVAVRSVATARMAEAERVARVFLGGPTEIAAYCRGPYCALAPAGVALLCEMGRQARRLKDGFPEWRLAGLPVEVGLQPA